MSYPSSVTPGAVLSLPIQIPALDNTMGAWLVGTFLSSLLQGVAYHQTYQYFCSYPDDPRWLKFWVVTLMLVETMNTVLSMHTCYYNLVTNYFNPVVLLAGPVWSLKFLPVTASAAPVITQLFFARRVYKVDRRFRPIAVIAGALVLAFSGCYVAMTVLGWDARNIQQFLKHTLLPTVASIMLFVGDVILTASLIYFLRRNRSGVIRTDSMLDTIIMYTVSSGLIICIVNVLNLAFTIACPRNLIYAAISIVLTKLYSNAFLVSLNTRHSLINQEIVMEGSREFRSTVVKQTPRANISLGLRRIEVPLEADQHVHISSLTQSNSTAMELKVLPCVLTAADSIDNTAAFEGGVPGATEPIDVV